MGLDLIDLLEMRPASTSRSFVRIKSVKILSRNVPQMQTFIRRSNIFVLKFFNNFYAVKNPDLAVINLGGPSGDCIYIQKELQKGCGLGDFPCIEKLLKVNILLRFVLKLKYDSDPHSKRSSITATQK
jgi:hypothetical protein